MYITNTPLTGQDFNDNSIIRYRIIALWALSESALGGVLHLFNIPFTGLIIGGFSSLLISLLAAMNMKRGTILHALLIVISVKALVAPYIPLNSYLALIIQGLLGELLFFSKKLYPISALTLGIITALLASFQKVIILTLLFGINLWIAMDSFINSVLKQLGAAHSSEIKFSYIITGIYVIIHLIGGLFFGMIAMRLPRWIKEKKEMINFAPVKIEEKPEESKEKGKKKLWYQRKSGIIFIIVSSAVIILSYILPGLGKGLGYDIIIMILRSLIITLAWFYLIAPFVIKLFKRFLAKNKIKYSGDIDKVIVMLPNLKNAVSASFNASSSFKGIKRIKEFISNITAYIVLSE